mmetsp:Transcript_53390/g.155340  ORF Transcript_53390/g.155340 Transcript_53390/m.155340 type:complete len:179 (-) Transcript_53390:41-577(-)
MHNRWRMALALIAVLLFASAQDAPRRNGGVSLMRLDNLGEEIGCRPGRGCIISCARCLEWKGVPKDEFRREVVNKDNSTALFKKQCPEGCGGLVKQIDMCVLWARQPQSWLAPSGLAGCRSRKCRKCIDKNNLYGRLLDDAIAASVGVESIKEVCKNDCRTFLDKIGKWTRLLERKTY